MNSVSLKDADRVVRSITQMVSDDGGVAVAVAVVGASGMLVAFAAMDDATPISGSLAMDKAYSALMLMKNTVELYSLKSDAGNYTDAKLTLFPGGVLLRNGQGEVCGAVGVSGRRGSKDLLPIDSPLRSFLQDHELVALGSRVFLDSESECGDSQ
jgi:glc operon protein GlcG